MLRTNSKKARDNIRAYIMEDADYILEYADYEKAALDPGDADAVLAYAFNIFKKEYGWKIARNYGYPGYSIFQEWAAGLALGGLFCYYYNRSAVEDLGNILEETAAEKAKYTEDQAEEMLTRLIYREMYNAAEKVK